MADQVPQWHELSDCLCLCHSQGHTHQLHESQVDIPQRSSWYQAARSAQGLTEPATNLAAGVQHSAGSKMSRTARWTAIGVAALGGTATKFFVAFAYSFTDEQGHAFAKPLLCMLSLFLGMALLALFTPCWPSIMRCVKGQSQISTIPSRDVETSLLTTEDGFAKTDSPPSHVTWKLLRLLAFFALMDVLATVALNVSLLYVAPALVASIRGLTSVWTLLLQTFIVPVMPHSWFGKIREHRDVLVWRDWAGAGLTVAGVVMAAITTIIPASQAQSQHHQPGAVNATAGVSVLEAGLGILFVIVATLTQALQFLCEQALLEDTGGLSPPAMVAYEGLFGGIISVGLLLVANFTPISPDLSASLDGSGYLERLWGTGGTISFLQHDPTILFVILGQTVGASVLCLGLFVLPSLGAGLAERTFALVGGRGAALVVVDVVVYQATNGRAGLPLTIWLLGDIAAVLFIIAGGVVTAAAQEQRTATRARLDGIVEALPGSPGDRDDDA